MFLIDFRKTPKEAFFHGFVKGLGAPVLLFHNEMAPGVPLVFQVSAPSIPIGQALVGDWYRIGGDMRTVVARHQEEISIRKERRAANRNVRQSRKNIAKKSRSKRR